MSVDGLVPLSEVCTIVGGGTPRRSNATYFGGAIPWATPTDVSKLDSLLIEQTKEAITEVGLNESSARLVPAGTVLMTSRATIGYTAIATRPMATNQGFANLICGKHVLPEYLAYWLRYQRGRLIQLAGGTTFKELPKSTLKKVRILLPPLIEQRRIIGILNRAAKIERLRKRAQVRLREFIPALFIEMFGDPIDNPLGWPICEVRGLGKVTTGSTPPSANTGMFGCATPFITPGDLESDHTVKRSLTDAGTEASRTVGAGATLVCCIGATIGKVSMSTVRSAFNQQINAVEWGEQVNAQYGFMVMRLFKPVITSRGSSTTLPILKKSSFERIEIPVPPLVLQQRFGEIVELAESTKVLTHSGCPSMRKLNASLMSRLLDSGTTLRDGQTCC